MQLAEPGPRGRPPLDDGLLRQLALAYLATASSGPGLVRRLARQFDRPEPTIKDWIAAARERGFLSAAVPGRRGAAPGPRLADDGPGSGGRPQGAGKAHGPGK
ncbi:hypothetical protein [Nonomuraea dietziae]|uniref:hypothetical protein n=1 Tax=Nonomuraea dietziae TaxID=65515 RepID=UPI0033CC53D3